MANILKDFKDAADAIVNSASRGFGVFMKNIMIIILLLILSFILTNPEILTHPTEYFQNFDKKIIWVIVISFILIGTIYQLAVSLNKTIKDKNNNKLVESVVNTLETTRKQNINKQIKEHNNLIEKRFYASPIIRSELKDLIIKLGATRASICEMHNGTNNLAGIPFLYLDMTYEEISPKVDYVIDNFKNFNLAKYPFITSHIKDMYWSGSIDDLKKEDPYLASRIKLNDTEYGAYIVLRGYDSTMIGLLVVTFNSDTFLPDEDSLLNSMMSSGGQILSTLLDKTCLYEIAEAEKMIRR